MSRSVLLANKSARTRVGCKGPAVGTWLATHGITVPQGANRFAVDERGLLAARLATSDFLFETMHADAPLAGAKGVLERAEMPPGVYPVLRHDFVLEITGPRAQELFAQTCAVDLLPVERESTASSGPVIMTSIIGVSVVLACRATSEGSCFTLWSDPSYSHYFWSQLLAIATDLGGGADPASPTRSGGQLT